MYMYTEGYGTRQTIRSPFTNDVGSDDLSRSILFTIFHTNYSNDLELFTLSLVCQGHVIIHNWKRHANRVTDGILINPPRCKKISPF